MNAAYKNDDPLDLEEADDAEAVPAKTCLGILLKDMINQRVIESVARQLELTPRIFDPSMTSSPELEELMECEMLVADGPAAREIRRVLATREQKGEGINPSVVAVLGIEAGAKPDPEETHAEENVFDGLLRMPQTPAAAAAQLGLILYSHRAFARRYQSALEELHLNRRIFRSVTSGISVADATLPDLPLIYVNPAFEVMTGYSLEEVQGRNCRFLQSGDTEQPGRTLLREAIHERREVTTILKNYRKDGSLFWNELSLSPIRSRSGEVTHFVGIQTDVTARVEFEAALRESEKLAAVGRLASSIAHEINNPLESVMNLIYLAQHTDAADELQYYLATADQELQRVKLITSQSLRFYKQSTKAQAVRASDLIGPVLDLYKSRLTNSRVRIERRERSTQSVICMESEIRQVLNNLVSNAIDAMHGPGGTLRLRSREATEWKTGAKGIIITVADNGSGISPETMKSIYKAFYTTKGIGGTGLGLWISSEIVERHHGRLIVRSSQAEGRHGTVFELFLPYGSPVAQDGVAISI